MLLMSSQRSCMPKMRKSYWSVSEIGSSPLKVDADDDGWVGIWKAPLPDDTAELKSGKSRKIYFIQTLIRWCTIYEKQPLERSVTLIWPLNTRGLSAWQLRCLIVYATLMMSNCLWYTAKLIPNDLDLTFQCHPRSNVMG